MRIGYSLSRCVLDILEEQVKEGDVLVIVARTRFDFNKHWKEIWDGYTTYNAWSDDTWSSYKDREEEVKAVVKRLWDNGKIHQPRLFGAFPPRMRHIWDEVVDIKPVLSKSVTGF